MPSQFNYPKQIQSLERAVVVSLGLIATNILITEGYRSLIKSTLALYSKFPGVNLLRSLLLPSTDVRVSIPMLADGDDVKSRPLKRYVSSKGPNKSKTTNDISCEIFMQTKTPLRMKDEFLLEMLHCGGGSVNGINALTVSDPRQEGNPIVYCSDAFCELSGYEATDILGKNLSMLEGRDTKSSDSIQIQEAINRKTEISICVVNYLKSGDMFFNQFFMAPLYSVDNELVYFIGVHVKVSSLEPGHDRENPAVVVSEDFGYKEDTETMGMLG